MVGLEEKVALPIPSSCLLWGTFILAEGVNNRDGTT
jgi:hypothetical protein